MHSGIDIDYIQKKVQRALEEYYSDEDKEGLETTLFLLCSDVCYSIRNKQAEIIRDLLDDLSGWQDIFPKNSHTYKQLEKCQESMVDWEENNARDF